MTIRLIIFAVSAVALISATACTDYLKPGNIDLTLPEPEVEQQEKIEYPQAYSFNHPCALVAESDIKRVRQSVAAQISTDPVYASWQRFCENSFANKDYKYSPLETIIRSGAANAARNNFIQAAKDAAAAWQLALRWRISGEQEYADKAVEILNAWADICKNITSSDNDRYLCAGFQGYTFANAAELLRDYNGWSQADQSDFKVWLRTVWLERNRWFLDNHGGSSVCNLHYWANWELANIASVLAIGIYCEDADIINYAYKNFREGEGSGNIDHFIPFATVEDPDVEILNAWADICKNITSSDNDRYLCAGFQGYTFANAAELLRDYNGWSQADQSDFKVWLRTVWLERNRWFLDNHGGSSVCNLHYWANWELANIASVLAIGIYCEDADIINYAYKNFREGEGSGNIDHFIPFATVEDPDGKTYALAQCMESGRDQGHATLVIAICAEICQMAWNIGLDFWGTYDNKILAMCEYTAKYNCKPIGIGQYICDDMPFTPYEYCLSGCGCRNTGHGARHTVVSKDSRGSNRPCWDLIYSHYTKEKKLPSNHAYYTQLYAKQLRYNNGVLSGDGGAGDERYGSNSSAFDQLGWSTMLFYRGE